MKIRRILFSSLLIIFFSGPAFAQSEVWTLSDCIHTALEHNLQVRQTVLTSEIKQVNKEQARASRFPTLDASVRQNFSWSDQQNAEGGYDFNDYNNTNLSLSSNLNLFNGFRTSSSIRQSRPVLADHRWGRSAATTTPGTRAASITRSHPQPG